MKEYQHERAAAEFEHDAGSITGSALNEMQMARRSFLGQIGRWSAALALVGLGPEAWMQVVSGRSIISSAVAAGAVRDRHLHPFPADDPYNLPLGTNAWYAPTSDPATASMITAGGEFNVNNGWSHPLYFPTTADPLLTTSLRAGGDGYGVRSYRPEEDKQNSLIERLQTDAIAPVTSLTWGDYHLHILIGNDLVEFWNWKRVSSTEATSLKIVRNRLDRCSFGMGWVRLENGTHVWRTSIDDPLRNQAGCRAHGGSAIAGLIRPHELQGPHPHIPHALALQARGGQDLTGYQQGDSASPAYNFNFVFPATASDAPNNGGAMSPTGQYNCPRFNYPCTGSVRMGMRFALDPAIVTDDWIMENAPKLSDGVTTNMVQVAVAKALRDYGCLIADDGPSKNSIAAQEFMPTALSNLLKNGGRGWSWLRPHLRRVAGRTSTGTIVQVPLESHWNTWRNAGHGWGGGAPRVPYSAPLAPLSGDVPPPPPEAPGAIEVTEVRAFDGAG